MERQLFAEYQVGSTLYGTRTPDSDQDVLRIYWPTLRELVSNQHVTFSQQVTGNDDIRGTLLGQFVMSLGSALDNSLLAMHTEEFKELTPLWMSYEFLDKLLNTAHNMWQFNQDKPKILAHSFRYWKAYVNLHNREDPTQYPMSEGEVLTYHWIRSGAEYTLDWTPTVRYNPSTPLRIDKQALAEWVWEKYRNHY